MYGFYDSKPQASGDATKEFAVQTAVSRAKAAHATLRDEIRSMNGAGRSVARAISEALPEFQHAKGLNTAKA